MTARRNKMLYEIATPMVKLGEAAGDLAIGPRRWS
jgi:hypothetical protein